MILPTHFYYLAAYLNGFDPQWEFDPTDYARLHEHTYNAARPGSIIIVLVGGIPRSMGSFETVQPPPDEPEEP